MDDYESMRITSHDTPFSVRIVREGERYGLKMCLVHERAEPMVEFYDARYDDERFTPGLGQFIARYPASSIVNIDDSPYSSHRKPGDGIMFDAGVWEWRMDGQELSEVRAWLAESLDATPAPAFR